MFDVIAGAPICFIGGVATSVPIRLTPHTAAQLSARRSIMSIKLTSPGSQTPTGAVIVVPVPITVDISGSPWPTNTRSACAAVAAYAPLNFCPWGSHVICPAGLAPSVITPVVESSRYAGALAVDPTHLVKVNPP